MIALAPLADGQQTASSPAASPAPTQTLPVILLTGFEPFGPGRPPNPSWEAVKRLDGRTWNGHKLVCRQMKVVWGQPLAQLRQWIAEFHPVAVFSFGQGGGFALENRARNARGSIPDNNGDRPPTPYAVDGGPAEFRATLDGKAVLSALRRAGFDAHLSTDAGAYLCEEALYTLEFLKAEQEIPLAVSFCHVPPLGAASERGPVTAAYVQRFVEDFLAAWQAATPAVGAVASAALAQARPSEDEAAIRALIDRYFRAWSNQDLVRYGQCFMPQAAIQLIDEAGRLNTMALAPFLKSQQEAHRRADNPLTEAPESVEVRFYDQLAHVLVYWKLVDGDRVEYGYDHFTLMRSDGNWRIANLIFYSVKPKPKSP